MCDLLAAIGLASPVAIPVIIYLEFVVFKENKPEYECNYNEWYCSGNGGCKIHKPRKQPIS